MAVLKMPVDMVLARSIRKKNLLNDQIAERRFLFHAVKGEIAENLKRIDGLFQRVYITVFIGTESSFPFMYHYVTINRLFISVYASRYRFCLQQYQIVVFLILCNDIAASTISDSILDILIFPHFLFQGKAWDRKHRSSKNVSA